MHILTAAHINTFFKYCLATGITAALLVWIQQTIGFRAILDSWKALSLSTLLICFALTLLSHTLRGIRLIHGYKLLNETTSASPVKTIAVSFIHNAANFILPMRLGEAVLPLLSRYKLQVSIKNSVSVLLGLRLFDLHVLVGLLLLLQSNWFGDYHLPLVIVFFGGLVLLPFFSNVSFIKPFYPPQFEGYLHIAFSYTLSLAIWLIKLVAFYWIFKHFAALSFVTAATGILTADLSSALPINGFASAGSYEAAFAAGLYVSQEFEQSILAAIINLHIFLLLSNIVAAAAGWVVLTVKK